MKDIVTFLTESTGMFKNAENIVDVMCNEIIKHKDDIELDDNGYYYIDIEEEMFKDIPNMFFKEATMVITNQLDSLGMYFVSQSDDEYIINKWDVENKVFNWIDIALSYDDLDASEFDEYEITQTLQHELQHAYQDWYRYKNNYIKKYIEQQKRKPLRGGSIDYYLDKDEFEGFLNNIQRFVKNFKGDMSIQDIFNKKLKYYDDYLVYKRIYASALDETSNMSNKQRKLANQYWNKLNNHIYSYITQN